MISIFYCAKCPNTPLTIHYKGRSTGLRIRSLTLTVGSVEWIKKMWHIYTMEYYSAIKRNEIELFVARWMDLETVIQSEVSQKEKNKHRMLTHIYGI